jgi:CRISPR-associated protein Cas2
LDRYVVALTVVITYDVSDDRRRTQISHVLQSLGHRIQRSVFLCCLEDAALLRLRARLERMIDPETDSVHIFRQCRACWSAASLHGRAEHRDDPIYWEAM